MKRTLTKLGLLILSVTFFLASCSKAPDKILYKKSGKWSAILTFHITSVGYDETNTSSATMLFDKNGSGTYTDAAGGVVTFTWSYSKDSEKLTYQEAGDDPIVFDVTEMEKKSEKWHNLRTEIIGLDTWVYDLTVDLTSID